MEKRAMAYPGTWMTQSQSMIYRLVPKCACSTLGQALFYSDHGRFYAGDIHDAQEGLHKWAFSESRPLIAEAVRGRRAYSFSCVRNPFARILSCFFDKIVGIQRDGTRYRGALADEIAHSYGIARGCPEDGFDFDQITSFRRFLLYARDTILWGRPMAPDIHWLPITADLGDFIRAGGRFDSLLHVETLAVGLPHVLQQVRPAHLPDIASMPRFNESAGHGPTRKYPISAYFDDLSLHLMWEIYREDFKLLGYDFLTPDDLSPKSEIDLAGFHRALEA